jgi:hypothetical protein
MKREELYGWEFDWFAIDSDGHIGHFSSAGHGFIPQVALEDTEAQSRLRKYLLESAGTTSAVLVTDRGGDYSEWLKIVSHGIFSYDFEIYHGPYALIARPVKARLISEFPENIQATIQIIRLDRICFQGERTIRPENYLE